MAERNKDWAAWRKDSIRQICEKMDGYNGMDQEVQYLLRAGVGRKIDEKYSSRESKEAAILTPALDALPEPKDRESGPRDPRTETIRWAKKWMASMGSDSTDRGLIEEALEILEGI